MYKYIQGVRNKKKEKKASRMGLRVALISNLTKDKGF